MGKNNHSEEIPKEIIFTGDYPQRLQDGFYEAKCIKYSEPYFFKGSRKITLTFELLNDPYEGMKLDWHMNIPLKGNSHGSNYCIYWTMVHGRPPSRNAVMSPRIFKGKTYRVHTRTVTKNARKKELPSNLWYSVIDDIELIDLPDIKDN